MVSNKLLPDRLKSDAIAEAVFELRFESSVSAAVPELAFVPLVASFGHPNVQRLPLADFPPAIRQSDPNLKFQPALELRATDGKRVVKVGANVVSYHALAPYPGWMVVREEMNDAIGKLFQTVPDVQIVRIGLRHINLLTAEHHFVNGPGDMDFAVQVEGRPLVESLNLNYSKALGDEHIATIRIATPDLVVGPKSDFAVLVDVDVATPEGFATRSSAHAGEWLESAHQFEKQEFFSLIPSELIDKMRVAG